MVKAKERVVSTRRSVARAAGSLPPGIRKKVIPLLGGFSEPTEEAFKLARDTLNNLIATHSKEKVSLEDTLMFYLSCALSDEGLPGYATLDFAHIREINLVLESIKNYAADASQKRPLNFLMLASPGAGKSHFIRCIAEKLGSTIGAVTYNMVGLERHEDLIPPLDTARNFKVDDKVPLLFLDEFDARPEHFALLLPLLWDGQMTLGRQNLKLGKVVVILAGSDPRLPDVMEHARSMGPGASPSDTDQPKLVDLLSRINGTVLRIPNLSDPLHVAERAADKICVAVVLLRHRFGRSLERVPLGLLKFIAVTEFRYGVRSIAHVIDSIPFVAGTTEISIASVGLPFQDLATLKKSSLAYHVMHHDHGHGILEAWQDAVRLTAPALISHESADYTLRLVRREKRLNPEVILEGLWSDLKDARGPI